MDGLFEFAHGFVCVSALFEEQGQAIARDNVFIVDFEGVAIGIFRFCYFVVRFVDAPEIIVGYRAFDIVLGGAF